MTFHHGCRGCSTSGWACDPERDQVVILVLGACDRGRFPCWTSILLHLVGSRRLSAQDALTRAAREGCRARCRPRGRGAATAPFGVPRVRSSACAGPACEYPEKEWIVTIIGCDLVRYKQNGHPMGLMFIPKAANLSRTVDQMWRWCRFVVGFRSATYSGAPYVGQVVREGRHGG